MMQAYATQKHPVGCSRRSSTSMINKFWSFYKKNIRMAFLVRQTTLMKTLEADTYARTLWPNSKPVMFGQHEMP
jgi:hypothetical protein